MYNRKDLLKKIDNLDIDIDKLIKERDEAYKQLRKYEAPFYHMQINLEKVKGRKNALVKFIRSIGAYILGRRNLKHLYSKSFKIKHAINRLKPYKYYLYNLGFIEVTLEQLKHLLKTNKDPYLNRAILWELGLWYANEQSTHGAKKSLVYFYEFLKEETDQTLIRQGTILLAENLRILGYQSDAKVILETLLEKDNHPDLYFARANLTKDLSKRLEWINKVYRHYNLSQITFANLRESPSYEDLQTIKSYEQTKKDPKVSVILPAYNAESGIKVAIESILNQSWQNIELLIVDDHSTDETLNVIKEYAEKDDRIKWFQTPVNSGPYVARNIALNHARGKYVTVNDADDWSHAEKLEIQVNHLEKNELIIANTSEHARLTEELTLHRRGTPGTYIFSNMSSLMFRRKEVLEEIGYWDTVRFAADGEFKRRLITVFGKDRIIDLKTGPLSLPRQSISSLTASSAFGYSGFFMGVRKEYVASFTDYHNRAKSLNYPFNPEKGLFPVPEPMWVKREKKENGTRHFEVVMLGDFSVADSLHNEVIKEINVHKNIGIRTGIVMKSCYNMSRPKELNNKVRKRINGRDVQVLVYGEDISCDLLVIRGHSAFMEDQLYLPNIKPHMVIVLLDDSLENIRGISRKILDKYGKRGLWYAFDEASLTKIKNSNLPDLRYIKLAKDPWQTTREIYQSRLKDWILTL